jgi:hypothetical protein
LTSDGGVVITRFVCLDVPAVLLGVPLLEWGVLR